MRRARHSNGQPGGPGRGIVIVPELTIRYAYESDIGALHHLAGLDSQVLPPGPLLVAEVGGELWAAVQVAGPAIIADPFRPTAELVTLLRARAEHVRGLIPSPRFASRLALARCPEPAWFGGSEPG